jgi:hypothetical protein
VQRVLDIDYAILGSYEAPPPFLCGLQYFCSSEEIEGHLPKQDIDGVSNQLRKPGPMSEMMKMSDTEVLLNNVTNFRDGLVPFFFIVGQLRSLGRFSHNAVFDLIEAKELAVVFSKIALIRKHLFDRVFGMTTAGDTQGEIGAVMEGSRGDLGGKNKAVTGINRSMFLQTKMGTIISHGPVGLKITGEFKRLAVFIQLAFRSFSFLPFFFQFIFAEGMTREANWVRSSLLMDFMISGENRLLNREKVQ